MPDIPLSECKFCPHCGTPKERWPVATYEFTPEAAPPGPQPARKPRKKSAPTPTAAGRARPVASKEAQVPATAAPVLSPAVQEIADNYPRGKYDAQMSWPRATVPIHELLKSGVAQSALVRAATLYRRKQAALRAVGTEAVLPPEIFFTKDVWQGPFEMPMDPEVAEDAKEARLTNEEWLASGYAKR
jgi:hypothetical protein